jgi:hypothetical protein
MFHSLLVGFRGLLLFYTFPIHILIEDVSVFVISSNVPIFTILKFGVIWTNNGEYFGEIENGEQNGHGTLTYPDGRKFVGEFKNGEYWNITGYDKNGNIFYKYVNGKGIKQ